MKDIRRWTEQAVAGIRAADEREAAKEELLAHFEDHRDALMERGMPKSRAEAEALQAMGDAEETGLLLKQAHSPWPHWLWRASRWMLAIAAIVLVFVFISELQEPVHRYFNTQNLEDTLAWFDEEDPSRTKRELPCSAEAKAGEYTLSIRRAQMVKLEGTSGGTFYSLNVILAAKGPVTLGPPEVLAHYMEAEDSSGAKLINLFRMPDIEDPAPYMNAALIGRKWRTHYFAVHCYHFDPDAEWMDLTYDRDGISFSMRIDLKGGAGS